MTENDDYDNLLYHQMHKIVNHIIDKLCMS